MESIDIYLAN